MQAALEALGAEKARLGARNAALQAELAGDEEELRKLRAAEESALPALADEELAARFGGDITLTARGAPVMLTSAQARAAPPRRRRPRPADTRAARRIGMRDLPEKKCQSSVLICFMYQRWRVWMRLASAVQ